MTRTFTIDNFRLKSTWSVKNKLGPGNEFIMYCTTPSTDSKTINLDLSAITSGSIIKSAFLKLNVNGAGDSFAVCNGVSVGTTNAKTTNPYDVTAWFTNVGSSASIKFTFQGYADVTTTSATCSFNDISITIDYELPNSTGTFNTTNVTVGQTITLTVNPANNNYTHQVVWRINGIQYGDVVNLPLGIRQCQLSFTDDMCFYAWNTATAPCEAELITIRDNGQGSVKYPFTFNVPDTSGYRPSISSSGTLKCTAVNNTFNGFVQYYTRIQFSLTGVSAGTGSSINNVAFSGWGGTVYSTSPDASGSYNATSDVLTTSGTVTIRAVVTDNRGRTVEKTMSINISAYVEPSIVAVSAKRCLQSGEVSDSGTYVNLSVRYNWANVSGNSLTIKSEYKEINETGYTAEIDQNVSANPFSKIIGNNSFGNDRSYDVRVTVADKTGRYASASLTIPTTVYVLHFKNGGKSIGIGRAAVEPATGEAGRVDVNPDWKVYIGDENNDIISKIASVPTSGAITELSQRIGAVENKFSNNILKVDAGGTGSSSALGALTNLGGTIKSGDVITLPTYGAYSGIITSSEKEFRWMIPVGRPIAATSAAFNDDTGTGYIVKPNGKVQFSGNNAVSTSAMYDSVTFTVSQDGFVGVGMTRNAGYGSNNVPAVFSVESPVRIKFS